jgi:hypothetical protein
VSSLRISRTSEGRWGIYDEDKALVGTEATERLATCHAEGRDTALAVALDPGFTDEEQAYMRGQWSILRRVIYPFGISEP